MKTKLVLFAAVFALVLRARSAETLNSSSLPRFDGVMGSGTEQWFALTLNGSDGATLKQAWLKTGQTLGGFGIVSFDPKTEMLTLKNPAGNSVELAMVDSKVRSAGETPKLGRDDARKFAANYIETYLKKIRAEHPGGEVLVNPDPASMPEDKRQDFLKRQEAFKVRTGSEQIMIPFRSADGRWGDALSTNPVRGSSLYPPAVFDSLTGEDRRELSARYSIARAEEIARSVPPRAKSP